MIFQEQPALPVLISTGTAKHKDCSEEASVMKGTVAPVVATALKIRAATPGTPSMPRPSTVMSCTSRTAVTALMMPVCLPFPFTSVVNECAGMGRVEGVQNFEDLSSFNHRSDGFGMQHLCPKIRQLGDFPIRKLRNCMSIVWPDADQPS